MPSSGKTSSSDDGALSSAASPTASTTTMIATAASTEPASTTATVRGEAKEQDNGRQAAQSSLVSAVVPLEVETASDGQRRPADGNNAPKQPVPSSAPVQHSAPPFSRLTTPQPMSGTRFMALVGMAFLWTSAQIPVYFWGTPLFLSFFFKTLSR